MILVGEPLFHFARVGVIMVLLGRGLSSPRYKAVILAYFILFHFILSYLYILSYLIKGELDARE